MAFLALHGFAGGSRQEVLLMSADTGRRRGGIAGDASRRSSREEKRESRQVRSGGKRPVACVAGFRRFPISRRVDVAAGLLA